MARVAWTLTDNTAEVQEVYEFPINPNEFTPPGRRSSVSQELSTAPNGQLVIFQGRDAPQSGSMRGAVMGEQAYEDLRLWFDKFYPLVLTDDLGQSWNILVSSVGWERLRRAHHPWRFDYTVEFVVF